MWNLLDIVSITADEEKCDPALLFWLVEELLDSQTIAGCRKVFDYLESRRERITSKHFAQKNLVILRSCNELLRRLSRAEDTAFCGRVFIFMFQSFPLGDKSSVNLRGEYHVENVTSFDDISLDANSPKDPMEVDAESKDAPVAPAAELRVPSGPSATSKSSADPKNPKSVTFDSKKPVLREKPIAADELYPIFWSLQQSFSQPKRLFEPVHFATFKKGLETTMATFQSVQAEQQSRGSTKSAEEGKRGTKRKREVNGDDELLNAFNPKYLTSRDLFELEVYSFDCPSYFVHVLTCSIRLVISLSDGTLPFRRSSSSTLCCLLAQRRKRSPQQLPPQTNL
jgi:THO complex subunit 1